MGQDIDIDIDIDKLTERPVVLFNAIFSIWHGRVGGRRTLGSVYSSCLLPSLSVNFVLQQTTTKQKQFVLYN